jgi:single-strand DNA-binding protein
MIKLQLIGRVGSKPELRQTKAGRPVANFNVAVSAGKDANGEYTSKWYPVTCWDGRAELAVKIIEKGDLVLIEGSPELSSWVDKKDEEHLELMVHCKFLQVLARSKRKDGEDPVATVAPQEITQSFDELPF